MTAQDYLKAIRAKGLTQAEIAARTDLPQGTISKIERGQKDVLTRTYLALQALYDELHPWDGVERRANPCSKKGKK